MKPWLLNILACPICKEHPLTIYILKVERNKLEDPEGLAEELVAQFKKGVLSEPSLGPVHNLSGTKGVDRLLAKARKAFASLSKQSHPTPKDLRPLVDYFHGLEILVGAMRCEKCGRWYPIGSRITGIPEMLPDEVRDKQADITFLQNHREELPDIIVSGSKPFTLE